MGNVQRTGDRALLRLGAQMAEVEALYACVLNTPDTQAERRLLDELAGAGTRLAELAHDLAEGRADRAVLVSPRRRRRTPKTRSRPPRTRLERRISRVTTTAEWIIARAGGAARDDDGLL